jgi:hypothetical protein
MTRYGDEIFPCGYAEVDLRRYERVIGEFLKSRGDGSLKESATAIDGPGVPMGGEESSIHDKLRRVHTIEMVFACVFLLGGAVLLRGKPVLPSQAIPVIDMLAQHNQFGARHRLLFVQKCQ